MDDQSRERKLAILKRAQKFFVSVAVATGLYWLWLGKAHTNGEWYFRLALTGSGFVGAYVTTLLIARMRSNK